MNGLGGGGLQDKSSVRLSSSGEVEYWCAEMKCDEQQLREAVERVGSCPDDVRRALTWGPAAGNLN